MKDRLYNWWQHIPATIRKPIVLIIGGLIVIGGIILLPLPGPGWVIIFIGFAVLASEFTFAEKIQNFLVNTLKKLGSAALAELKRDWINPFQP
jgi:uncharacterized protein (TIGR02611 family)